MSLDRNTLVFSIYKLEDIKRVLIPMFEQFPLNFKKRLDYLAFKKAFLMFVNRNTSNLNKQDLFRDIVHIKDSMNDKRVKFYLPEGHIRITGNYLVGILEGDGSYLARPPLLCLWQRARNKNDMSTRVSLVKFTQGRR
jgi:hypothetical protein